MNTLHPLRFKPIIKAKPGEHGGRNNRTGRGGADLVVQVPVEPPSRTGSRANSLASWPRREQQVILKRGKRRTRQRSSGTSTNRAPTRSEPGGPGESHELLIELKLLADVGLLGFPNAGKSTLISRLSAAKPKVAYPFDLSPRSVWSRCPAVATLLVADIPGLIEGAAEAGLQGIASSAMSSAVVCCCTILSLDPYEDESNGSPRERFDKINSELRRYDPELAGRRRSSC